MITSLLCFMYCMFAMIFVINPIYMREYFKKKTTDLQLLPSLLAATIKLQNNRLRNNKSICNKHENL